jgi:high-affinity nickel-transport protein
MLGMRHATDADHVVAVTTIVSDQPSLKRASTIGALWGIGHGITILLVGGAIILFRVTVPPRLGLAFEFTVALMLVVLGFFNLSGRSIAPKSSRARPFVVGLVHGLAGSAFVAMLILTAIPGALLGLVYLALFGVGTVAGMALITLALAVPAALTTHRFGRLQHGLRVASGLASIAFGLVLAHHGIADGLLSADPQWTPR